MPRADPDEAGCLAQLSESLFAGQPAHTCTRQGKQDTHHSLRHDSTAASAPFPRVACRQGEVAGTTVLSWRGRDGRPGRRKNVVAGPHFHTPMLATQWLST